VLPPLDRPLVRPVVALARSGAARTVAVALVAGHTADVGVGERSQQGVERTVVERGVGVGEHQDVPDAHVDGALEGARLPGARQVEHHGLAAVVSGDLDGAIGRPVRGHDDLDDLLARLSVDAVERRTDRRLLVVGGDDDAHAADRHLAEPERLRPNERAHADVQREPDVSGADRPERRVHRCVSEGATGTTAHRELPVMCCSVPDHDGKRTLPDQTLCQAPDQPITTALAASRTATRRRA